MLFTREQGKLSAVAKGVKRARSKLAGGLQLFAYANVQLAAGRTLEIVTQVQPLDMFYHLRQDMNRYFHACYAAELIEAFIEEGASAADLFELLVIILKGLNEGADPPTLLRGFELKLLFRLGYGPELDTCVSCGVEVEGGPAGFAVAEGGIVCARCARALGVMSVSPTAWRALRELQKMPPEELMSRKLSPAAREELARVMRLFVDYQLPRALHSAAFLPK